MQPKLNWRKHFYWIPASRLGSRLLSPILPIVDRFIFRVTRGRQTAASAIAGLPSILLITTGAKSGLPRQTPLLGFPFENGTIVIGTNWGGKRTPAWVFNLRADPNVTVGQDGKLISCVAREVFGEERDRCWNEAVKYYPGYNGYKQRAQREIGIFLLEPREQ